MNFRKFSFILLLFIILFSNKAFGTIQVSFQDVKDSLRSILSVKTIPDTTRAIVLFQLGKSFLYDYPDSSNYYSLLALEIAKKADFPKGEAMALNNLGTAHYINADYEKALEIILQSYEIFNSIDYKPGLASTLNRLGSIYLMDEEYQKAIEHHRESIMISEVIDDFKMLCSAYFNMAIVYDNLGVYDSALVWLDKAKELSESIDYFQLIAMSFSRRGEIYYNMGLYSNAIVEYQKVMIYNDYQSKWETCFACSGLAKSYFVIGEFENSIKYGLQSMKLAQEMGAKWEVQRAVETLANAYLANQSYKEAYHYQVLNKVYGDSIFNEQKAKDINRLQLQRQEAENTSLEIENQVQQVKIYRQNLLVGLSGGLIVVLLIYAISLYRNMLQKNRLNSELLLKNETIKVQNEAIALKNEKLNLLNETKDRLFTILGHDLRGPLQSMNSIIPLLKDDILSKEELNESLDSLQNRIDQVGGMLVNLLNWAQSQLSGIVAKPEIIDVSEIVKQELDYLKVNAINKNIAITQNKENASKVFFDPEHLRIVVRNIIANAMKYTYKGGEINILYECENDYCKIIISDNGIGMRKEKIDKLFQSFGSELAEPGTNNEQGTGLGLVICKDFIDKNYGKIEVISEEGKGSTFIIWMKISE